MGMTSVLSLSGGAMTGALIIGAVVLVIVWLSMR
jgi:hypothetical protein